MSEFYYDDEYDDMPPARLTQFPPPRGSSRPPTAPLEMDAEDVKRQHYAVPDRWRAPGTRAMPAAREWLTGERQLDSLPVLDDPLAPVPHLGRPSDDDEDDGAADEGPRFHFVDATRVRRNPPPVRPPHRYLPGEIHWNLVDNREDIIERFSETDFNHAYVLRGSANQLLPQRVIEWMAENTPWTSLHGALEQYQADPSGNNALTLLVAVNATTVFMRAHSLGDLREFVARLRGVRSFTQTEQNPMDHLELAKACCVYMPPHLMLDQGDPTATAILVMCIMCMLKNPRAYFGQGIEAQLGAEWLNELSLLGEQIVRLWQEKIDQFRDERSAAYISHKDRLVQAITASLASGASLVQVSDIELEWGGGGHSWRRLREAFPFANLRLVDNGLAVGDGAAAPVAPPAIRGQGAYSTGVPSGHAQLDALAKRAGERAGLGPRHGHARAPGGGGGGKKKPQSWISGGKGRPLKPVGAGKAAAAAAAKRKKEAEKKKNKNKKQGGSKLMDVARAIGNMAKAEVAGYIKNSVKSTVKNAAEDYLEDSLGQGAQIARQLGSSLLSGGNVAEAAAEVGEDLGEDALEDVLAL